MKIVPRFKFREKKLEEMCNIALKTKASEIQIFAIILKEHKDEGEMWRVGNLSITESLGDKIIKLTSDYLSEKCDLKIQDFEIENDQSDDHSIDKLSDSEIPVLNKIISEMKRADNKSISYQELSTSRDLKGFAITFAKNLTIFIKVTKTNLLNSKKYFYIIPSSNGEFTDIVNENLLSVPNSLDTILYNDQLYIFDRNKFIQLFRYEETFEYFITNAQTSLANIMDDPQFLIDESKHNLKILRRLASACAGYVDRIEKGNIDLEPIAKEYNLEISFSNGKIVAKDSILSDILTLLNGNAVKDAIFSEKYLAYEKTKV